MKAKFCFACGKALVMKYPGGDPENGPAELRCPDNKHPTMLEEAYDHFVQDGTIKVEKDSSDPLEGSHESD